MRLPAQVGAGARFFCFFFNRNYVHLLYFIPKQTIFCQETLQANARSSASLPAAMIGASGSLGSQLHQIALKFIICSPNTAGWKSQHQEQSIKHLECVLAR